MRQGRGFVKHSWPEEEDVAHAAVRTMAALALYASLKFLQEHSLHPLHNISSASEQYSVQSFGAKELPARA